MISTVAGSDDIYSIAPPDSAWGFLRCNWIRAGLSTRGQAAAMVRIAVRFERLSRCRVMDRLPDAPVLSPVARLGAAVCRTLSWFLHTASEPLSGLAVPPTPRDTGKKMTRVVVAEPMYDVVLRASAPFLLLFQIRVEALCITILFAVTRSLSSGP